LAASQKKIDRSIFNAAAKMTVGNEKKCYFGLVNGLMENYSRDLT
jgi:hypothetical protein